MANKIKMPTVEEIYPGLYRVRVQQDGKRHSVYGHTVQDTLNEYYRILAGEEIKRNQRNDPKSMTVGECIDRYIEMRSDVLSPSTVRGYTIVRNNSFRSIIDKPVRSVGLRDAQEAINIDSRSKTGKTIVNNWRLFASAIEAATGVTYNVKLPQIIRNEHEYLTAEQIPVFIEAMKGQKPAAQIGALLGLHSLRRSEICDITWRDIDLDANIIHVRGSAVYNADGKLVHKQTNKTECSRRDIPIMIPALRSLLEECRKDSGFVVTIAPNTLQRTIDRVCLDAGLPAVGTHGLRHSFCSLAVSIGMDPNICAKLGGWSSDLTTMRKIYTHISERDVNKAAEKMAAFFQQNY